MHEIALVNTAAANFLVEVGDTQVRQVVMAIGPKVEEEVARQAWEIAVDGTAVAAAELVFEPALDELKCFSCEKVYFGELLAACPDCSGTGLIVNPAEEVTITSWTA